MSYYYWFYSCIILVILVLRYIILNGVLINIQQACNNNAFFLKKLKTCILNIKLNFIHDIFIALFWGCKIRRLHVYRFPLKIKETCLFFRLKKMVQWTAFIWNDTVTLWWTLAGPVETNYIKWVLSCNGVTKIQKKILFRNDKNSS